MGAMRFGQKHLQLYAHFNTPLVDPRELRETFNTYERTGKFFARPLQIGQSEMYLHFLWTMNKTLGESGLDGVFITTALFEALSILIQIAIFHHVFNITDKKASYAGAVLFFVAVNPIQLIGGLCHLGSFNDFLFYLLILFPLIGDSQARKPSINSMVNALCSYFDPRLLFLLIPITVL